MPATDRRRPSDRELIKELVARREELFPKKDDNRALIASVSRGNRVIKRAKVEIEAMEKRLAARDRRDARRQEKERKRREELERRFPGGIIGLLNSSLGSAPNKRYD